jgi:prepilin-type N-terminal cleavage/methylation domain-containing protein
MRMTIQRPTRKAMDPRGFTLIELLVAVVLSAFLVAVVYGMLISFKTAVISQESSVEIQQGARFAAGKLKRDLELIGAKAKSGLGQKAVVYAGGWELLFNGDLGNVSVGETGDEMGVGELIPGTAISYGGGGAYTYNGGREVDPGVYEHFDSDAETVHYKMHTPTSLPGEKMGSKDYSFHDDDRELRRWINGSDDMSTVVGFGIRTGYDVKDAVSMPYEDGEEVQPLFKYWGDWDFDPTTPDSLWGDSDTAGPGFGLLSSGEISALLDGTFSMIITGPTGIPVTAGSVAGGGISLTGGVSFLSNSEHHAGVDLNGNGRLDANLLDTQLHRVEIDLGVIAQNPGERGEVFSHGSKFSEARITSNVFLRNIVELVDTTGGDPPKPPTDCAATISVCGESMLVSFTASEDDGKGEQDVTYYVVLRKGEATADDDEPGSPIFNLYTNIPAQGIGTDGELRTYEFYDHDVQAEFCYQYKIIAVDIADQRSDPCTTDEECFVGADSPVPAPGDIEVWDSPCHVSNNDFGSMTLMWEQSQLPSGAVDPGIDAYWIYRSLPNDVNTFVRIAKVPVADADDSCLGMTSHPECPIGFDVIHAECKCRDENYYTWVDPSSVDWLVWRDQEGSPGQEALPPLHSAAHAILTTGSYEDYDENESSIIQYRYQVRAHRESDGCESDFTQFSPECFAEGQSFNSSKDSPTPSRYSPPWNVHVNDVSDYMIGGSMVNTPKFSVDWTASPSEFCEYTNSLSNANIPDLTRYYIYRSKTPQQEISDHLIPIMLEEDNSDPPIITPEFRNDAPAQILVYKGRVRGGEVGAGVNSVWHGYRGYDEPDSTGSGSPGYYSWVDSDQRITDADVWYIVTGGNFKLQPQVFGSPVQHFDADLVMPGPDTGLDPIYEYMVAAVSADDTLNYSSGYPAENPTPKSGAAEWSIGPSCIVNASFGCSCVFGMQDVFINYCSLVTPSTTDDVDAIEVSWRWIGNVPPVDGEGNPNTDGVDLVYNIQAPSNEADSEWHLAEIVVPEGDSLDCGWGGMPACTGLHLYERFKDSAGDPGFGLVYQYGVRMKCESGDDSCSRIMPLLISEQAGFPDESHICYKSQHPPGSPECDETDDFPDGYNDVDFPTGANCQTGEVRIELREMLNSCGGLVETDEDYVWWRVVRLSTSQVNPDGTFPWPDEPENGNYECVKSDPGCNPAWDCVTTVYSDESEYAANSQCYGTLHYTGYWLRVGELIATEGVPPNPGDKMSYEAYDDEAGNFYSYANAPSLTFIDNEAGIRRVMFTETLNPNFNYKYIFTIGIKHPPQEKLVRPDCLTQPGLIGGDQCNGGFDGKIYSDAPNKYTVIVDFANKDQCYPPRTGVMAGDIGPPFPAAAEAKDTLGWSGGRIESNTKPWKNWEWSITLFHWTVPFLGIVIDWTIGDHAFEYSGSYLRSDIDGFFGGLVNWVIAWVGDLSDQLCNFCIDLWGVPIFCVRAIWPGCDQFLTNLVNHNYLWSNFYSGVCDSNTTGDYHTILYDYMAQMHIRTTEPDLRLNMAIHGSYTPWDLSHQLLNLEMDFRGAGTLKTRLIHKVGSSTPTVGTGATYVIGTDTSDDDWYSAFFLICMNRVNPALKGETFLFFWVTRDAGKSHDWKTSNLVNYFNTDPFITWSSEGRSVSSTIGNKRVPLPEVEARTGCNCTPAGSSTWRCPTGRPMRCVLPPKGAFGFFAEPYVDISVTEYRYDNIRITPYCGKCPPDHLWAYTQAAINARR